MCADCWLLDVDVIWLFVAWCLLIGVLLYGVCSSLRVACGLRVVVCCLLFGVRCLLFVVYCVDMRCALFAVRCLLFGVHVCKLLCVVCHVVFVGLCLVCVAACS